MITGITVAIMVSLTPRRAISPMVQMEEIITVTKGSIIPPAFLKERNRDKMMIRTTRGIKTTRSLVIFWLMRTAMTGVPAKKTSTSFISICFRSFWISSYMIFLLSFGVTPSAVFSKLVFMEIRIWVDL